MRNPAQTTRNTDVDVRFPASALKAAADAAAAAARATRPTAGAGPLSPLATSAIGPPKAEGAGFSSVLHGALQEASALQNESGQLQKDFQAGVDGVSLEQTMVAMQKGQIAFQSAVTVRNRLVSAYTDIMNMQV